MATKKINIMNLQVGNIVHFYGARFEITAVTIRAETQEDMKERNPFYMQADGKWLDGAIETGYFGPNKDWNFQGNSNVVHTIEE